MPPYKIFMSNLGYARGINGSLAHHLVFAHRHFYCPPSVQRKVMLEANALIAAYDPDICCLVEIDHYVDPLVKNIQLEILLNEQYPFFDIENKYGPGSPLRALWLTRGKSNAILAKQNVEFKKLYFKAGMKRLVYQVNPRPDLTLFFAHFSLNKVQRTLQIEEARRMMEATEGDKIFLGDFNILDGFQELAPLLADSNIVLMNGDNMPTFTFHKRHLILDICVCSRSIAERARLDVIPQPFSDHAALLLTLDGAHA